MLPEGVNRRIFCQVLALFEAKLDQTPVRNTICVAALGCLRKMLTTYDATQLTMRPLVAEVATFARHQYALALMQQLCELDATL